MTRIWSLNPRLLDGKGLVALWRETLGAQAILKRELEGAGRIGYQNHPQLIRFRELDDPLAAIGSYLRQVEVAARQRKYNFNVDLIINPCKINGVMEVTQGQIDFELEHLRRKLELRSPQTLEHWHKTQPNDRVMPLFRVVPGEKASWERG